MHFIYNRGSIIFIVCGIVSLIPISLASAMVVYANTFAAPTSHPAMSFGSVLLFLTPIIVYIMGDLIFYYKIVKHQLISSQEKVQSVIGFMLAFFTMYCIYFFSLDMISELFKTLSHMT